MNIANAVQKIRSATGIDDIAEVFGELFQIMAAPPAPEPAVPDFGLKVRGLKARENINAMARDIIERVDSHEDLTAEDIEVLKQYSGRGGLTENSQFEYYTPPGVAEGVWDILAQHGFGGGNVLDPCTGHGTFSATKPKGVVVSGTDLDPVGSKIARLLHPEDSIQTGPFETLAASVEDDTYDSVVGNVPFGDARGASAQEDLAYRKEKRIERYFILRSIDKCKPGGLVCLVTPPAVVDSRSEKWKEFRALVSKKAEFLGAHKLPSKTFSAQGTDTVTDIVVFKKHPKDLAEKIDDLDIETLKKTNVLWDEFISGTYWMGEGRRFIQGTYIPKIDGDRWSRETVDGDIDPAAIKAKLAIRFSSRIDWDALDVAPVSPKNYIAGDRRSIDGIEHEFDGENWVRVQTVAAGAAVDAERYGLPTEEAIRDASQSPAEMLKITAAQAFAIHMTWPDLLPPAVKAAVQFAMGQDNEAIFEQAYRGSLIGGMLEQLGDAQDNGAELERLQALVVAEISRYGHPKKNASGIQLTGGSSRAFGLFMNSVDENGVFSDLLAGTLNKDRMKFNPADIQSIVEHLCLREGLGQVELEDVQGLYSGGLKIEDFGDLAMIDGIALTPQGFIMPLGRYCSGDVYPKISDMTLAMADEPDDRVKAKYQQQIDAILRKVKVTKPEDIWFGLQEKWFPRKYLLEFLHGNGFPNAAFGRVEDDKDGDKTWVDDLDDPFGWFTGVSEGRGGYLRQFENYLNGENITSSGENAQKNIEEYKGQVKAFTENFNAWMQQHPDLDQIAGMYNRKFNAFVRYDYETDPIEIDGFKQSLSGYQAATIRQMSETGGGIIGLDVGLGKTRTAIALHLYNKQMGRTKKDVIVVPDSVLANWYRSIAKAVTDFDDILFIGIEPKLKGGKPVMEPVLDKDGSQKIDPATGQPMTQPILRIVKDKESIWKGMWEIPTTSKSLVVMTKEKFGAIPLKKQTRIKHVDEMMARQSLSDKNAIEAIGGTVKKEAEFDDDGKKKKSRKISYQDHKDQLKAEEKYADEGTRKKEELPYFEDMGFTGIFGDEFHYFKNSYRAGEKTGNIAYLPTAPSSQRAIDMTIKTAYLRSQNDGRGIYPLTATPVTNSPFEIYNMLAYVMPLQELERYGIYTVDDFVRVFGKSEQVDKLTVRGEINKLDGLVGFRNLDGLRNVFHKYCILKTAQDVNLPLPPHEEINEELTMTGDQSDAYTGLRERAKEAAKRGNKEGSLFSVMRDMDRVTTDMDLYNRTMTFIFRPEDEPKVVALSKDLPKQVEAFVDSDEDEGPKKKKKEMIDLVPQFSKKSGNLVMVVPESAEEPVVVRFKQFGLDEAHVTHPLMPKYAKLVENVRRHLESSGKQLVFTEEKTQHQKLARILSHHIPMAADKLAIINATEASGAKLQSISDAYNSGSIRVIIANKKAEVGVNLQKGTTAIHHLTLPWTPASIRQRNGRGLRQGNTAENIKIYYYLAGRSFDYYRLDLLKSKSGWMHQLFNGDENEVENADAMSQDDMLDVLAENPEEAKRRRIERLEKEKEEQAERERRRLANLIQQLANINDTLKNFEDRRTAKATELANSNRKLRGEIEDIQKEGAALKPGDEKRQKLAAKLANKKAKLAKQEADLKNIDAIFEARRMEMEKKGKQAKALLQAKARKGELPFDPSLIDHPENALVSLSGIMYSVGDMYEFRKKDGATEWIIKIVEVHQEPKSIGYDVVLGDVYSYSLPRRKFQSGIENKVVLLSEFPKQLIKVNYSESDIELRKLLSRTTTYRELIDGIVDEKIFFENVNEVNLYGLMLYRDASGGLAFEDAGDIGDKSSIVFPKKTDEAFRKAVAEAYLADRRSKDGLTTSSVAQILQAIFGYDWRTEAEKYGRIATETEIRTAFAEKTHEYLEEHGFPGGVNNNDDDGRLYKILNGYDFNNHIEKELLKLGDNSDGIKKVMFQCIRDTHSVVANRYNKQKAEEEERKRQEEQEALKSDPNYKELPENIRLAFKKLGVEVRINTANVILPGGRKEYGGGRWPDRKLLAFSTWFLQDSSGKGGSLFRAKEALKSRFGAMFYKGESGQFTGAWWYMPSSHPLEKIFSAL